MHRSGISILLANVKMNVYVNWNIRRFLVLLCVELSGSYTSSKKQLDILTLKTLVAKFIECTIYLATTGIA